MCVGRRLGAIDIINVVHTMFILGSVNEPDKTINVINQNQNIENKQNKVGTLFSI